jgi:hypothetical protein
MAVRWQTRGRVSRGQGPLRTSELFSIFLVVMISGILAGCGSSSTGSTQASAAVSFSTNTVSFKAAAPFAQAPAAQTITGTVTGVTSGTLYVTVQVNNPNNLFTVTSPTIMGSSGQISVIPAIPSSFSAGTFSGSITINVCLNDATCHTGQLPGSPQTIPVSYVIASGVDGNAVTPRVVPANAAGTVILRGAGFTGATSVDFGSAAASSLTVVSDSEIDASYPALAAGSYPVTINSGNISFSASMLAVSPPAFTATAIPYPTGDALIYPDTAGIEYDAGRTALFVLLPGGNSTNPTLLRYAFDGSAWGTPTQFSVAGLLQVHLSPDGTHLLALVMADNADTSMVELDPVTLAQTKVTTVANPSVPVSGANACGFAIANDGNAIVDFAFGDNAFAFGTSSRVFTPMSNGGACDPVASGNGAVVALSGMNYLASSETFIQPGAQTDSEASGDFVGDKFVYSGSVEDGAGEFLGYTTGLFGQIINSPATRVYGIRPDPTSGEPTLVTFDLTAAPSGNPPLFPELGTPIALPNNCSPTGCTGGFNALATTPDGSVIFVASPDGVIVQPIS